MSSEGSSLMWIQNSYNRSQTFRDIYKFVHKNMVPQAGFDPPRHWRLLSTECEADARPPSHHGWIPERLIRVPNQMKRMLLSEYNYIFKKRSFVTILASRLMRRVIRNRDLSIVDCRLQTDECRLH